MLKNISNIVFSVVVIVLLLSLLFNGIQYFTRRQITEETIVRDTTTTLDTIYEIIEYDSIVYRPVPVEVYDTINVYRDTTYHEFGYAVTRENVYGEILSKEIEFNFNVPEYYKTQTITNTITRTIRNDLVFINAGLSANMNGGVYPALGAVYIWNKQKNMIHLNYSLDKRIELSVGFSIWR